MEERVNFLVQKFQDGQLEDVEKQELLTFVDEYPAVVSAEIMKMIADHENVKDEADMDKWSVIADRIVSVDRPHSVKKMKFSLYFRWAAAAIFIVALTTVLTVYKEKKEVHVFASDIAPGGNKAILTLADGKKISLSDAANGDLIKQAGLSISKTADGQLVYNVEKTDRILDNAKMNTISTPNGGEWQIRLPDGSTVWLNAASSLEYPLDIGVDKNRIVKLNGEAYFEVAKDAARPFIVETEKQKLEVLGTHFNVNSYPDEHTTRTTLLEGSVRISDVKNLSASEILKPGEQSVLSGNGIKVNAVNTDESIAWKNGYFKFDNEKQESIMRKISRWYNVQVEYADQEAKEVMYYGTMSRFEKISQVLRKFEQTGEVRFDLKGNKLIVYKE